MERGSNVLELLSPEQIEKPYPLYAALREQAAVFHIEGPDIWVVTRFRDCQAVLKDPDTFRQWDGSEMFEPGEGPAWGNPDYWSLEVREVMETGLPVRPGLVKSDPPEHGRLRHVANEAWSPKRTAEDMDPRVRELANELVDGFVADGEVELVRRFADPFPTMVIGEILGVPRTDWGRFKKWSEDAVVALGGGVPKERLVESAKSIVEWQGYFVSLIEDRRRNPRDDVLTAMLAASAAAEMPLDDTDILSILMQLLGAGNVTTTHFISSTMWLILAQPGLAAQLIEQPVLIAPVVEETLRLESPVQGLFRRTVRDVEVSGVRLPAGAKVLVVYASANRDESMFPNGDAFDPHRPNASRHMAFGYGIHACLGAALARKEGQVAVEVLLARLPNLRLRPPGHVTHNPHPLLRGLQELWLEFDVQTPSTPEESEPAGGER